MTKLADRTLVCVIWDDAHGTASGEYTEDEIAKDLHQPMPIKSFGLKVQDDERGVSLANEITSEDLDVLPTYRGVSFIPRAMVKEVIDLGVPARRRKRAERSKISGAPEC